MGSVSPGGLCCHITTSQSLGTLCSTRDRLCSTASGMLPLPDSVFTISSCRSIVLWTLKRHIAFYGVVTQHDAHAPHTCASTECCAVYHICSAGSLQAGLTLLLHGLIPASQLPAWMSTSEYQHSLCQHTPA